MAALAHFIWPVIFSTTEQSTHVCFKENDSVEESSYYPSASVWQNSSEIPMRHFCDFNGSRASLCTWRESATASSVIRTSINDHKIPLLWSPPLILPVSHSFSLLREKYHKELNLMPNPNLAAVLLLYQAAGSRWDFSIEYWDWWDGTSDFKQLEVAAYSRIGLCYRVWEKKINACMKALYTGGLF